MDTTYHVALDALLAAVEAAGNANQRTALDELIDNDRLADLSRLPQDLLY